MTRAELFDFEGNAMTVREIRELVPALSDKAIRDHLRAGRNTRRAMLTHVPRQPKKRNPFSLYRGERKP